MLKLPICALACSSNLYAAGASVQAALDNDARMMHAPLEALSFGVLPRRVWLVDDCQVFKKHVCLLSAPNARPLFRLFRHCNRVADAKKGKHRNCWLDPNTTMYVSLVSPILAPHLLQL
jgi:hypothetical protein